MLLFKRCKHDWKIVEKTFASPAGVTTVLVQCSKCRKIKKYEMLGRRSRL